MYGHVFRHQNCLVVLMLVICVTVPCFVIHAGIDENLVPVFYILFAVSTAETYSIHNEGTCAYFVF